MWQFAQSVVSIGSSVTQHLHFLFDLEVIWVLLIEVSSAGSGSVAKPVLIGQLRVWQLRHSVESISSSVTMHFFLSTLTHLLNLADVDL